MSAICNRWVSGSVAIRYHALLAGDQMVAALAWVEVHACDTIDHIDIYDTYVVMQGRNRDQQDSAQTAIRSGDPSADLDEVYRRLWRRSPPPSGVGTFDSKHVRVNGSLSEREQVELGTWVNTCDGDEIANVTIDPAAVRIHGRHLGRSAIAVRYPGRLLGALDEAIATLRDTP